MADSSLLFLTVPGAAGAEAISSQPSPQRDDWQQARSRDF